jgi:hypothetical protein
MVLEKHVSTVTVHILLLAYCITVVSYIRKICPLDCKW